MIPASVALIFFFLFTPSPLSAHAYLVKSIPAQRAVLYRAPTKVQLWFNERLEPRYSSLSVSDENGKPIEIGQNAVDSNDAKLLAAALNPLPAGRYVIKYRVLSVDGHVVENQFPFTIKR